MPHHTRFAGSECRLLQAAHVYPLSIRFGRGLVLRLRSQDSQAGTDTSGCSLQRSADHSVRSSLYQKAKELRVFLG
jgi:hypothetical protein